MMVDQDIHAEALEQLFRNRPTTFQAELNFAHFMHRVQIERNECWHWLGAVTRGHPIYVHGEGTHEMARRFILRNMGRPVPDDKLVVCACIVPCVNPSHLEVLTRSEMLTRRARIKKALASVE